MKTLLTSLLLALLAAAPAGAICTATGTVTDTSTQILPAHDIPIKDGRSYLFVQNSGTENPMMVSLDTNNNATSAGFYLGPGASLTMMQVPSQQGASLGMLQVFPDVPQSDVAAIAPDGDTTFVVCDW